MAASLESMLSENPLLIWKEGFPVFSAIRSEHFMPAVEHVIANYSVTLAEILTVPEVSRTWENTIARLEIARNDFIRVRDLIGHLHNVVADLPGFEDSYDKASQLIKGFEIELF